ncbi:hypothetical protein NLI96_g13022 [Meripilus lineatus]|uniref:Uncharacterized protein n=1 Tax=Meripilus lineatus TaxID=2056292 RepID=A0AAD5UR84_9APHY|nr:hypothetical protein NLI96_g13022 [Physisporinus lineatus]
MLFTNIQQNDFEGMPTQFEEKLVIEGGKYIKEREWIMMAVINISAILEYRKQTAVLKHVAGIKGIVAASSSPISGNGAIATGKVKLMVGKKPDEGDKDMEIDNEST